MVVSRAVSEAEDTLKSCFSHHHTEIQLGDSKKIPIFREVVAVDNREHVRGFQTDNAMTQCECVCLYGD